MQREVILVLGKTGYGKTTWANLYIQEETRVVIVDAGFNEFGAAPVRSLTELIDAIDSRTANGAGSFGVSYTPQGDEIDAVFDVAMAANRNAGGDVVNQSLILIEEANILGEPEAGSTYEYAIIKGRHDGLSIMAVTLFPALLSIKLRSQATRLILFRQDEPAHLKWLEGKVGRTVAEEVRALDRFEFIDWNQGEWQRMKILKTAGGFSFGAIPPKKIS